MNYTEELLQSIDIIAQSWAESLKFDQTIICTITDNDNRARGEYIVDDGASTFVAYSENTTYPVKASVYVTIPQGDYNNKKIIIGRHTSSDSEQYNYIAPMDTYVDITNNILKQFVKMPASILANGPTSSVLIYREDYVNKSYNGYDRLGVKATFKTDLKDLKPIAGDYGIIIKLKTTTGDVNYKFTTSDMFGDVYNFSSFFEQQAVFDIDGLNILGLEMYLYQDGEFKSQIASDDLPDIYIPSRVETGSMLGETGETIWYADNIFIEDVKISLGYDLNDFTKDTVIAYTLDSSLLEYDAEASSNRIREINIRWIRKTDYGFKQMTLDDIYECPARGYLYRFDPSVTSAEDIERYGKFANGALWRDTGKSLEEIYPIAIVECDGDLQDDYFKVVFVSPPSDRLTFIQTFINDIERRDLFTADDVAELMQVLNGYTATGWDIDKNTEVRKALEKMLADYPEGSDQYKKISSSLDLWVAYPEYDSCSAEIAFHNTTPVELAQITNMITGLEITIGDNQDPYKGVYNVYGEDRRILNQALTARHQKLKLTYNSLATGFTQFDGSELVTWKIPLTDTMIRYPERGIEYKDDDIVEFFNDAGLKVNQNVATWMHITRYCNIADSAGIGEIKEIQTEQIFRIKDYYSSVGRNKVECKVTRNAYAYYTDTVLIFGTAGTNGTDYTFRLIADKNAITSVDNIILTPHLYNYNNQELPVSSVNVSYMSKNTYNATIGNVDLVNNNIIPPLPMTSWEYNIIQGKIQVDSLNLTTYYPVARSNNLEKYNHYEGPDFVIYNTQGVEATYFKDAIKLYDAQDHLVPNITWTLEIKNTSDNLNFYPRLANDDNGYQKLRVPNLYLKELGACRLVGKQNGTIVWIQPLVIMQNHYGLSVINSWNGELSVDSENNMILTSMVGAGKKDINNAFTGVLMGEVSKTSNSTPLTGLYGYQKGVQTFGLTEDGVATIGGAASGQITINGNTGTIESGNHINDSTTGMKINLTDGHIDAYNFKLSSNNVIIDSSPSAINYFTIKGDGSYNTTSHTYDVNGYCTSENTSTITVTGKTLMVIGKNDFRLSTLNYEDSATEKQGFSINLKTGAFNAYNGFKLVATNFNVGTDQNGKHGKGELVLDATAPTYPIQLKYMNTTPFQLAWNGYLTTTRLQANGGTIGGWNINNSGLYAGPTASPYITLKADGAASATVLTNYSYGSKNNHDTYSQTSGPYLSLGAGGGSVTIREYTGISSADIISGKNSNSTSFSDTEVGKYVQVSGKSTYYRVASTTSPYFETVFVGSGGLTILGGTAKSGSTTITGGLVSAKNLYIEGGGGVWDGYATYTSSWGHVHKLSGNIPYQVANTYSNVAKYKTTTLSDNPIIIEKISSCPISVTGTYSGDSQKGLTFNPIVSSRLAGEPDQENSELYYPQSAYLDKKTSGYTYIRFYPSSGSSRWYRITYDNGNFSYSTTYVNPGWQLFSIFDPSLE